MPRKEISAQDGLPDIREMKKLAGVQAPGKLQLQCLHAKRRDLGAVGSDEVGGRVCGRCVPNRKDTDISATVH